MNKVHFYPGSQKGLLPGVAEEDKPKTAPFGKFEFNRMPFGLKGAKSTFQDKVLAGKDGYTAVDQHLKDLYRGYLQVSQTECQAECTFLECVVKRGEFKSSHKLFVTSSSHSPRMSDHSLRQKCWGCTQPIR